jgi:hypothetical protein
MQNSASAACRIVNVFIFNVGRCARSAVRGREHSLTRRPLSIDPGAGTTNGDAAKIPHSTHKGWSTFFGCGTTRNDSRWRAWPVRRALCPATSHRPPWAKD